MQVFLRRPLDQVRTIALDPASRASAALVQVVLAERAAPAPRCLELDAGEDPRRSPADAWLRIGDRALQELWGAEPEPPTFNPSAAWAAQTGLPFAFAVWIARPGVELERFAPLFARARSRGARRTAAVARDAAARLGVPLERCARYLSRECLYEPGDELEPALLAFGERAAALGLCRSDLRPVRVPCGSPPLEASESTCLES